MEPDYFIDWRFRAFHPDPSGRHRYREVVNGKWGETVATGERKRASKDPEGARELNARGVPVPSNRLMQEGAPPSPPSPTLTAERAGNDGVATALTVIGWIGVLASVSVGLLLAAEGASNSSYGYSDSTGPLPGIIVGVVGTVQSLMLIGFARIVQFAKSTAVLLAENLEEVRS